MDARTRLGWIEFYQTVGNAGVVCRRCGISRPTWRKWWRRYQVLGVAGLEEESRRPRHSPARKVFDREEELILPLRRDRGLGIKPRRNALICEPASTLALDAIHHVLVRHGESRLTRRWVRPKVPKRYIGPLPGDRVQVDVCKVGLGIDPYTAVADGSRFMVVGIDQRRTARNTVDFLERVSRRCPCRSSASRPIVARSSSPTWVKTSCARDASGSARSGRARRL
jgi:transposase-like protein